MLRQEQVFRIPSMEWIEEKMSAFQKLLEKRTQQFALILRKVLGKIILEPTQEDSGKSYYVAVSKLNVLALLDGIPDKKQPADGSNSYQWWTRSQRIRTFAEMDFQVILQDKS